MDDKLAKTIGAAAKVARQTRKLTQEGAADVIGVSPEFYARIERGKTLPSVPTLVGMVAGLCVSADVLLGLDSSVGAKPRGDVGVAGTESGPVRQLGRRLRRAQPSTIRVINLILREIETASREMATERRRAAAERKRERARTGRR